MAYSQTVARIYGNNTLRFTVPWEHEKSELQILSVLFDKDAYQWAVVDAGTLTYTASTGVYTLACPFGEAAANCYWGIYVWRQTDDTESVEFDGTRIPIESIVEKFDELTRKTEENAQEARRALRSPEADSDMFYPPKDVRADEVAGFDSEGKPAVGKNVKGVKEIYDARDEAVEAAESAKIAEAEVGEYVSRAETAAEDAETSAQIASDAAINAGGYANQAYQYATSAQESADSAKESADAASSSEETVVKTVDRLEDEIKYIEDNGIIINVPVATSTLAGKVKLSTDAEIGGSNNVFGLVGFNNEGQLVVPIAVASSTLGVVMPYSQTFAVSDLGLMTLLPCSTSDIGGAKLSTSDILICNENANESNLSKMGGAIGVNSDGQLVAKAATSSTFGTVKLGSQFSPTHGLPYVVGIGMSSNTTNDTIYGQIAFNLKETQANDSAGALKYMRTGSGTSGSSTYYELQVAEATASQMGVMYLQECDGDEENTAANVNAIAAIQKVANDALTRANVAYNSASFRIATPFDSDGNECYDFSTNAEEQTFPITFKIWFKPQFLEDATITFGTADWVSLSGDISEVAETGVMNLVLTENPYATDRTAKVVFSYGMASVSVALVQHGRLSVSVDGDLSAYGDIAGLLNRAAELNVQD